ncbi:Uu.00g019810.m01.CDS01 [Anthostomella pinea]|uniref:Uu.00g019810.m01.CDS01 n=1 Tax=Anthostomella pinea TaxID=933095 RepID=A0AAI8YNL3_9PEZI|nr:Uu.00g019810.m01.CDS01 [Anthostomella pinea]
MRTSDRTDAPGSAGVIFREAEAVLASAQKQQGDKLSCGVGDPQLGGHALKHVERCIFQKSGRFTATVESIRDNPEVVEASI